MSQYDKLRRKKEKLQDTSYDVIDVDTMDAETADDIEPSEYVLQGQPMVI